VSAAVVGSAAHAITATTINAAAAKPSRLVMLIESRGARFDLLDAGLSGTIIDGGYITTLTILIHQLT
jgi:hypothetical protein